MYTIIMFPVCTPNWLRVYYLSEQVFMGMLWECCDNIQITGKKKKEVEKLFMHDVSSPVYLISENGLIWFYCY